MEINELKLLAASVATLGDNLAEAAGSRVVLLAAVLSLVRTHPDQKRFAEEFRRAWLLLRPPRLQHPYPLLPNSRR